MHAIVHWADVQDRDGGVTLLTTLLGWFPDLEKLFAVRRGSANLDRWISG